MVLLISVNSIHIKHEKFWSQTISTSKKWKLSNTSKIRFNHVFNLQQIHKKTLMLIWHCQSILDITKYRVASYMLLRGRLFWSRLGLSVLSLVHTAQNGKPQEEFSLEKPFQKEAILQWRRKWEWIWAAIPTSSAIQSRGGSYILEATRSNSTRDRETAGNHRDTDGRNPTDSGKQAKSHAGSKNKTITNCFTL